MSSAATNKVSSATPITPNSLKAFLTDAPSIYKHKLQRSGEKQILTNCYRALWSNNNEWMQRYFFKEGYNDNDSLTQLLEKYNLLHGSHTHDNLRERVLSTLADSLIDDQLPDEPEYSKSQRGKQCGHLFKRGESVYRCRNCGLDDTCVMCSRCFYASNHEGHDVKIWVSRGAGGCCDCGDDEAWKSPLECRIHSITAEYDESGQKVVIPTMEPYDSIPPALIQSVQDTITVVIDYLLETFAASPENIIPGKEADILKDCKESHAALHIRDLPNEKRPSYTCILWNDENHSFDQVIDIVVKAIKCTKEEAQKVAENVDAYGRHVIMVSDDLNKVLKAAKVITSIKLAVTVRSTQNTIREDICGILLEWLKDLISGKYNFFTTIQGGTSIVRDIICKVLCDDWCLPPDLAILSGHSRRKRNPDTNNDEDDDDDDDGDNNEIMHEVDEPEFDGSPGDTDEDTDGENIQFFMRPMSTLHDEMLNPDDIDQIIEDDDINWVLPNEDMEDGVVEDTEEDEYEDDHEDDHEDLEYHDADDDIEMNEYNDDDDNDHNNSDDNSESENNNSDIDTSNDDIFNSVTSTFESIKQQHNKPSTDILEMSYDLDEWLDHTEKLENMERELAQTLGIPVSSSTKSTSEYNNQIKKEFKRKLRLDYLLQFDLRLWKSARISIKDIMIGTLISNFDYRPILGIRFARNYPDLVDAFFFKDREPEHTVTSQSVQMLTVPTVAWMLVKEYKFFGIVSSILSNFFLTDHVHMLLPEKYRTMQVDCKSRSITRHRYAYTLYDLRYVLNAEPVKSEVIHNPIYLRYFLDVLYQFQAMDPLKRQMDVHVEYESNLWVSAFNVTLQVSKLCCHFTDCFSPTSHPNLNDANIIELSRDLCRSIYRVIYQLYTWDPHPANVNDDGDDEEKEDKSDNNDSDHVDKTEPDSRSNKMIIRGIKAQKFKTVTTTHSGSFEIVDYDVARRPVSFHHPMHWLLSELLEHVYLLKDEYLAELGWQDGFKQMIQTAIKHSSYDVFLTILDYPLRTLVMIAQINCGIWVRNGHGVRNQTRTYRDISVRENTLDRDVYLLQVGFITVNHDHLLATMLDRFKLWDWFNGKPTKQHTDYEPPQLSFIVEEFLNLLIVFATERGYASGMTIEGQIRRSIIQYLGISNLAYSELVKFIPESQHENESFETILGTLANYKPPDGLNDHGLYELKEEFYNELDPYFWHFTRNQREEAFESLRKHWKRQHPDETLDEKEEFFAEPHLIKIKFGPFTHLSDFLHSGMLCQIVTHALWNTKISTNPNETILEAALYLIILALDDEYYLHQQSSKALKGKYRADIPMEDTATTYSNFIQHATTNQYTIIVNEIERDHATLLTVLLRCLDDDNMKHVRKRLHYIVNKIELYGSTETKSIIQEWRWKYEKAVAEAQQNQSATNAQTEYERKKAAAKARQAAIMSQFAEAQSKFLSQHGELYDEEDEESDHENDMEDIAVLEERKTETDVLDGDFEVERICHFPAGTCIVCQEELDKNKLYGVLGLVQNSHISRQTPFKKSNIIVDICEASQGRNPVIEHAETIPGKKTDFHGFPSDSNKPGIHISSCGHLMHAKCFANYQASVDSEVLGTLQELLPGFLLASRKQFLCPFCKALGNILLPIVWKGKTESFPGIISPRTSYNEDVVERINDVISQYTEETQDDPTVQIPGSFNSTAPSSNTTSNSASPMANTDIVLSTEKLVTLRTLYTQFLKSLQVTSGSYNPLMRLNLYESIPQLLDMYSYTISAIEIAQRNNPDAENITRDLTVEHTGTFLDGITPQNQTLLKILAKTNELLPKILDTSLRGNEPNYMKKLVLKYFSQVIYQQNKETENKNQSITPLIYDDPFSILTAIGFCDLSNDHGIEIHHIMRLMYLADITKTIISLVQMLTGNEVIDDPRIQNHLQTVKEEEQWSNLSTLRDFTYNIMNHLNVPSAMVDDFFKKIDINVFAAFVRTFTLPFLRKSLLLMVAHHGFVPQPPDDDKTKTTTTMDEQDINNTNPAINEYNHLLSILKLPMFKDVFTLEPFEMKLLENWCSHYSDSLIHQQSSQSLTLSPSNNDNILSEYTKLMPLKLNLPTPFSLISLPYRMEQLIDESSRRVCRKCNSVPDDPALCLMCGTIVCARRYCCTENDRGECNNHMRTCGGEIGIYMVIKQCFILFLHDTGGTIMSAPYLDAHGEVDIFLKRGAPQYLYTKRYEQIRQMWLSHSIPAFVRRRMEVSNNYQNWLGW
ncbi:hypothetical protein BJ944DRAFT_86273 [Cunninghamella echinulata]|nr:hypothetical protein BJ944DRAFT_86273 [Cunninghamella echinulata]